MPRALALLFLLLLCTSPAHAAGGADITWGDACWVDAGRVAETFACDTDAGSSTITVSFQLADDQPHFVALVAVIDLRADAGSLPDWWQLFDFGTCRRLALLADVAPGAETPACADAWAGQGAGGIGAYQTAGSVPPVPNGLANAARIKGFFVRGADTTLVAGVHYRGCHLTLLHSNTTGPGACAGCATGVTLSLSEVVAEASTGGTQHLTTPTPGGNQCLTWNGSTLDCAALPARNVTWARVKSRYR